MYLYRSKRISVRQTPLHVFISMMKLLAETDFVGDDYDFGREVSGASSDAIRTSRSIGYRYSGLRFNFGKGKNRRQTIYMPPSAEGKGSMKHLAVEDDVDDLISLHKEHGCDAVFLDSTEFSTSWLIAVHRK